MKRALTGNGNGKFLELQVDRIVPNSRQPRIRFDEEALEELANSIREHGVLQAPLVRALGDGNYELIAGERRFRAAQLAGLMTIPVVVRSADNQLSLELAILENVQREDINPIECAKAYRRLIEEFGLTQDDVADKVGKSRSAVANNLRLLRLPKRILDAVEEGTISEGHARSVLGVADSLTQLGLFDEVLRNELSVRETESRARALAENRLPTRRKVIKPPAMDANDQAVQEGLCQHLGGPVKLQRRDGGGTLTVDFFSDDNLMEVLDRMGFRL